MSMRGLRFTVMRGEAPVFGKILRMVQRERIRKYLETRDKFREAEGQKEPYWAVSSFRVLGHMQKGKRSIADLSALNRVLWDKLSTKRNRRELGACVLCHGGHDSQEHVLLECTDLEVSQHRRKALEELDSGILATSVKELAVLETLEHIRERAPRSHRIWTGTLGPVDFGALRDRRIGPSGYRLLCKYISPLVQGARLMMAVRSKRVMEDRAENDRAPRRRIGFYATEEVNRLAPLSGGVIISAADVSGVGRQALQEEHGRKRSERQREVRSMGRNLRKWIRDGVNGKTPITTVNQGALVVLSPEGGLAEGMESSEQGSPATRKRSWEEGEEQMEKNLRPYRGGGSVISRKRPWIEETQTRDLRQRTELLSTSEDNCVRKDLEEGEYESEDESNSSEGRQGIG